MALTRPSLPDYTIIDVHYDNQVVFEIFGGDRIIGYEVEIYNNETNVFVVRLTESNIASNRIKIQANTNNLSNGTIYNMQIRTFDEKGNYSNWSDRKILNCYTTPVCTIDNIAIDGDVRVVPDQNYIFVGSYQQSEKIAISNFRYVVYDADKNVIQKFSVIDSSRIESNSKLEQRVEGFAPDTMYHIELLCTDSYGLEVSSGLISFIARYEVPRIKQIVELENEQETASVKISSEMIQIIFKLEDDENAIYLDEQEIQLYRGSGKNRTPITAYVDEYLNIPENFTLKIYCRKIPRKEINQKEYFLTLKSYDGLTKICLKEYDNRIHVYKITTPKPSGSEIVGHYVSDVIEGYKPNNSSVVIQINHVNGRFDVTAQLIGAVA